MCDAPQPYQTSLLAACCRRITDGSHFSPTPQEAGLPIANVKDMRDGYIDVDACTKISQAEFDLLAANNCVISSGMVLLSKDGTVGKVVAYQQPERIAALSSIALICPFDTVAANYLAHALSSHASKRQYENFMSGSALRRLVLRDIRQIVVPIPDRAIQAKIAEVLDTLDAAIRGTEAVVAKLRAMKQGLLHDLLTRGIDANGDLRPPQPEAPHLYHQTPLGWLPKGWEISDLGSITSVITSGSRGWARFYSEDGQLFVRSQNVRMGALDLTEKQHVRVAAAAEGARTGLEGADFLVTITGNGVGNACVVPEEWEETAFVSQHVGLIRFFDKSLGGYAGRYFIAGGPGNHQILDAQYGQSKPGLSLGNLRNLRMGIPPAPERVRLMAILAETDKKVAQESVLLDKLRLQKSGLMDDLLTGRVPVTPLL